MYGADWCGDCRRAKAFFDERDIAYDYVDLVDNPDETERVLERNNGVKKIPVIVFADDSHLVEPSNDELAAKLAELAAANNESSTTTVGTTPRGGVVENTTLERFELLHQGQVVSFACRRGKHRDPACRDRPSPSGQWLRGGAHGRHACVAARLRTNRCAPVPIRRWPHSRQPCPPRSPDEVGGS